jgi:hypothetical protein
MSFVGVFIDGVRRWVAAVSINEDTWVEFVICLRSECDLCSIYFMYLHGRSIPFDATLEYDRRP